MEKTAIQISLLFPKKKAISLFVHLFLSLQCDSSSIISLASNYNKEQQGVIQKKSRTSRLRSRLKKRYILQMCQSHQCMLVSYLTSLCSLPYNFVPNAVQHLQTLSYIKEYNGVYFFCPNYGIFKAGMSHFIINIRLIQL